jgi:hypothetical protein
MYSWRNTLFLSQGGWVVDCAWVACENKGHAIGGSLWHAIPEEMAHYTDVLEIVAMPQ